MTTSLIDSLNNLATPDLTSRFASSLDEPEQNVAAGLRGCYGSMLMGVLGKTSDSSAMSSLFSIVTNSDNDGRVLDDPSSLIGAGSDNPMVSLGSQFLSSIFGGSASAVNDVLARSSGLGGSSVASLMQFAAPLLIGVLGKNVREGGLTTAESFTKLFTDQRDDIQRAAPPGISDALGAPPSYVEHELPRETIPRADQRAAYTAEPQKKNRWVWPTVAALVVLALLWGGRSRRRPVPETVVPPPVSSTAGGELAPSLNVVRIQLPDGNVLNVVGSSPEARMVAFLTNPAGRVSDSAWMVLDHLQFEANSARLRPESREQLQHVDQVLKAYPKATVKIGGFTDSTGNEAANMKLSRERAESTRRAIVDMGIAPSRVTAEGYGSQHPIAPNSTEAGRAQNRRISLLITKK